MATKPLASAIIDGGAFSSYGTRETVTIRPSRARGCTVMFYAPGWRPMGFSTLERACAKLARHPGFVQWVRA